MTERVTASKSASPIDRRSFILGMMTAFAECIANECKKAALSPPFYPEDYDMVLPEAENIAREQGIYLWYDKNLDIPETNRLNWFVLYKFSEVLDEYKRFRNQGNNPAWNMAKEIKRTICFRCKPRCRLELEVEDNQIVNVSTSPIKKCPRKWASDLERFYHPDRLNYPLKRAGEKGENKWQQITWDEALDEIAAKLQKLKDQYGAETLGVTAGTSRTYEELNSRFLNLFGSPNQCGQAQICHGNSAMA